jgi:deoxycytidylate deaminase
MSKQFITATIYDKKGRLLSTGHNSYIKTHPMQARLAAEIGDPLKTFLHAEIDAIIKCKGKPHKIKIERKNKQGRLGLAKPCPICELAIKRAKIKYIEYST